MLTIKYFINFISNVFGDGSLIDWSKITNAKNSNDYNSLIKQALDTGDVQYISRGGFEDYGIPDFRQYLKDKFIDDMMEMSFVVKTKA